MRKRIQKNLIIGNQKSIMTDMVLHRIFFESSKTISSKEWADFLKKCSIGQFPKGVHFEGRTLKSTRKGNSFSVVIPMQPDEAAKILLPLFRDTLKVKATEKQIYSAQTITKWSDISKKKHLKRSVVQDFSEEYGKTHHLTSHEISHLSEFLLMSLKNKSLTYADMPLKDGKIAHVAGLRFDYPTRKFFLSAKKLTPSPLVTVVPCNFTPVQQIDPDHAYAVLLDYHMSKSGKSML